VKSTVTQATAIVCAAGSWGDKALVTDATATSTTIDYAVFTLATVAGSCSKRRTALSGIGAGPAEYSAHVGA